MDKLVIIGAGGFAREVVDICDAINHETPKFDILGYVVDPDYGKPGDVVNDLPILGGFNWLEDNTNSVFVTCAVGASHQRFQLVNRAYALGCRFTNMIHPSAILTRWITLGEGIVIAAGSILTNQIRLGNHVHINLDCTIGHDVVIDDFSTLSPGVHVSGNVHIDHGCYIGTGANIVEKVNLGSWSIIGAGSTIVNHVEPNTTVVGVPGKTIKIREAGWHHAND